jgi:hypothetical protein
MASKRDVDAPLQFFAHDVEEELHVHATQSTDGGMPSPCHSDNERFVCQHDFRARG